MPIILIDKLFEYIASLLNMSRLYVYLILDFSLTQTGGAILQTQMQYNDVDYNILKHNLYIYIDTYLYMSHNLFLFPRQNQANKNRIYLLPNTI